MASELVIPFPRLGVVDAVARAEQPPLSTRKALNVWPYEASGTLRGRPRPGLYNAGQTADSPSFIAFGRHNGVALSCLDAPGPANLGRDGVWYSLGKARTGGQWVTLNPHAGSLPGNITYSTIWRDRLILCSGAQIYASRAGDYLDWDEATPPADDTARPWSLTHADVIQSLAPAGNDTLLLLGSRSIARLAGDPANGGYLAVVSEGIGVPDYSPRCWAADPGGRIWCVTRKGLYVWNGAGLSPIGQGQFDSYFAPGVAYAAHWDTGRNGLLLIRPNSAGATHLFYDARNGGFWPWSAPAGKTIGGVAGLDTVYVACLDGSLWELRDAALADDPTGTPVAIDSYLYLGPIAPAGATVNTKLLSLDITGGELPDGCAGYRLDWKVQVGRDAYSALENPDYWISDSILSPATRHLLRPRATGACLFVRLGNATAHRYWSVDSVVARCQAAGRTR